MQSCEGLFLVFMFGFRNAFVFLATAISRWNSNMSTEASSFCVEDRPARLILCLCVTMASQCTGPVVLGNTCPAFIKNCLGARSNVAKCVWCAAFANLCRRALGISVWHSFHSAIWSSVAPFLLLAQPGNESMFSFLRSMLTPC